jgi:uncharacterized protein
MTLYESNYIRLGWLCGDLSRLADAGEARVDDSVALAFRVEERGPYTTLLCLTLQLAESLPAPAFPQLRVRVYHDARVVEAADVQVSPAATAPLPVTGERLAPRWARNVLLNKWLEYCADRGCRFHPAAATVG